METAFVGPEQPARLKKVKPVLGAAARLTVSAAATGEGLPSESCAWTVTAPEQTPAVRICGAVVKASRVGGSGLMVSVCAAAGANGAVAVTAKLPLAVPLKKKDVALVPPGMLTELTVPPPQPAAA